MGALRLRGWLQAREQELREHPLPAREIRSILQDGTALDLRRLVATHYLGAYRGNLHAHALERDAGINYYRIDVAPALRQPLVSPGQPLIVFLPPAEMEEQRFQNYFGGGVEDFCRAVGAGVILPTVGAADQYKGPLAERLLEGLAALPEESWPLYANTIPDSLGMAGGTPPLAERFGRLRQSWLSMPTVHHWAIAGKPSSLPGVENVDRWVMQRLGWFDSMLPKPAWGLLAHALATVERDRSERGLAAFLDLMHVLQGLFVSPVIYSRGPSLRVQPDDLLHWRETLAAWGRGLKEREAAMQERVGAIADLQGTVQGAMQVAEGLASGQAPFVVQGAKELLDVWVPSTNDLYGRVLRDGDYQDRAAQHADLTGRIQIGFASSRADLARLEEQAGQVNQLLKEALAVPARLRLLRTEACVLTLQLGGTLASPLVPWLEPFVAASGMAWEGVKEAWEDSIGKKVGRSLNPQFQVGLDVRRLGPKADEAAKGPSSPPPSSAR